MFPWTELPFLCRFFLLCYCRPSDLLLCSLSCDGEPVEHLQQASWRPLFCMMCFCTAFVTHLKKSRILSSYLPIFVTSAMFSPLSRPYCTQNVLLIETWCLEELKSMSVGPAIACGSYCTWTCFLTDRSGR